MFMQSCWNSIDGGVAVLMIPELRAWMFELGDAVVKVIAVETNNEVHDKLSIAVIYVFSASLLLMIFALSTDRLV